MNQTQQEEEVLVNDEEVQHLMQCLPKATCYGGKFQLVKYQSFWHFDYLRGLKSTLAFQRHFRARDSDFIIASHPKTGTTWLKSLLFAVVNRVHHPANQSPLLAHHPHELVYRLEYDIYGDAFTFPRPHHLNELPSPRLFSTHLPYHSLPESIKTSRCKILYIGRNPLDTCVSQWHFYLKSSRKYLMKEDLQPPPIEDYFEEFYEGKILYGPFFEHMLGYWEQSLKQSNKVLFLKYEDLKDNTTLHLERLAEFVGLPFSPEEENQGVVEEIVNLCGINNLKELEGNKSGIFNKFFEKKSYFRKGEVGDWTHYFASPIAERMKKLMEEKLRGTGLSFQLLPS